MIELQDRTVTLYNLSTRVEKHGEEERPALDLGIEVSGPNTMLDAIGKELRASLFAPATDAPEELDLTIDPLPVVRNPKMVPPIRLEHEQAGMTASIAYGLDEQTAIVLGAVRLHKVKITSMAFGGAVQLRFTLSTTDVDERTAGKLVLLQGHEVTLTLTAAEVVPEAQMTPQDAGLFPLDESDAPPTAEEVFARTAEVDADDVPF